MELLEATAAGYGNFEKFMLAKWQKKQRRGKKQGGQCAAKIAR